MEAVAELESKALTVQERGAAITIKNDVELTAANEFVKDVKALIKEVGLTFDPIVTKAHETHKAAVAGRKMHLDPLESIERLVKGKMSTYIEAKEAAARREQARLEELARKEREAEQAKADKKIAALMEKAGGMQEQIDALKAEIEASTNVMEIEKMERQVDVLTRKLEAAQVKVAEVAQAAEEVYEMPAPVIQAKPQVQGMSTRQVTEIVSVDIKALAVAVAAGTAPIGVFEPNEGAIKKLVDAGMTLAGVVTKKRTVVSTKS